MKRSDLIQLDGSYWIVGHTNGTEATLVSPGGGLTKIPLDLDVKEPDRCKVVCCPTFEWPFVVIRGRLAWGKLIGVGRPSSGANLVDLRVFVDWVIGEPLRSGGALYLNPELRIKPQERLVLQYEKFQTSVVVPRTFATYKKRVESVRPPPDNRPSIYERLLSGDDD